MATYEFEVLKFTTKADTEDYLNDVGASGWQCVGMDTIQEEQTGQVFLSTTYLILQKETA